MHLGFVDESLRRSQRCYYCLKQENAAIALVVLQKCWHSFHPLNAAFHIGPSERAGNIDTVTH